jgi:hypothetical protein
LKLLDILGAYGCIHNLLLDACFLKELITLLQA